MKKQLFSNCRILIVEARFYQIYADDLLAGAKAALEEAGAAYDVVTVPGALEVPAAIGFAAANGVSYDGYIALGCVIRGETYHFDLVANESCRGLMNLSLERGLAIGNGIVTVENAAQAKARTDKEQKDKGGFAARTALAMIELKRKFR